MKELYRLLPVLLLTIMILFPAYGQTYNYAEVLQKSMFFYEAQRSGVLPANNRITWRGNAAVHDGSDVNLDLSGGWFDAGDHIKFGLPMSYSVTTLCWGAIEFPDGYINSSQMAYFKSNIKWTTDYLLKCHVAPHVMYAQCSDESDHKYWVPAEMVELEQARSSYLINESKPGTELAAEAAAAMASASIIFKDSDPTYSATLIAHAKQLYEFADLFRGKYSDVVPVGSMYPSWSGYQDELCWGAIWLYLATNDNSYLTKAKTEYDKLSNENQTTTKSYGWTLAWDDKSYGCYVLMSKITGEQKYKDDSERWLNQWFQNRTETKGPSFTGVGFPILDSWGSFRYAANTAFCMRVYAKYAGDATKATKYKDRSKWIIDYLLGNNPQKTSYVIGFGSKFPLYPHHRTAHGSWCRDEKKPAETRHTLYGALVGGHKTNDDLNWTDDRHDYYWNEVATDYNSCFTGIIAALTQEFGGTPLTNFPVAETPKDEFVVEAKINSSGNTYTEYSVWVSNHTAWPARIPSQWKYRLFVDITEGLAAGYKVSDYIVSSNNSTVTFTGLTAWDAAKNIYYTEVTYNSEILIWPGGQGESTEESQIRIRLPYEAPASAWNPANDYSYTNITSTLAQTNYIPLYADGKLVAGKEPGPSITYTITATAGTGGTITPSGSVIVSAGANQTFTISPAPGYRITGVNVDGTSAGAVTAYTFTNVNANHTIAASFGTVPTDTITATAGTGGTITPSGKVPVLRSANQSFTIAANAGYKISDVTVDGASVGAVTTYTFSNVSANHTITASFAVVPTYTITATASTGGSISPSGVITVSDGACQSFTITPLTGYRVKDIVVDGISKGPNSSTSLCISGANRTINVIFESIPTYTITASAGTGGSITPSGSVTVYEGTDQTFAIAANTNYKISDVKVDGTSQGAITGYTFKNVTANHTIAATFDSVTCNLLSLYGAPTSSPLASLNSNYKYVYVLGSHAAITNINKFTINWDLANNGLYEFSINTSNGVPNWYVDLRSVMTYKFNASAPYVTIKSSGTSLDGDYYVAIDNGNFVMIDKSAAYAIYFSNSTTAPQDCGTVVNYTISASAGTGGTITPSGSVSVSKGGSKTFAISASTGYTISDVTVDGISQGAISTYTFTTVTANHTIAAAFSPVTSTYTITASAGTGGTISPSGSVVVDSGANQSFAIAASSGYKISDVTVDGVSQGAVASYTFTNVIAHHTIAASFLLDQGCNLLTLFGVPSTSALPTIANKSFTHAYVLGTGGPGLSNVTTYTINWDLPNNGLYQFSFNTNDGVPGWWIDLLPKITKSLNVASPSLKIMGSGISGLDDDYWVNYDGTLFIMVAKSGNFAIVGSNSSTPPSGCSNAKNAKEIANGSNANSSEFGIYPNPVDENGSFTINLKNIPYEQLTISIIDLNGRKIISKSMKQTTDNFAFEYKLSKGVYIVTLESTNGKYFKTLIVK